MFNMQGIYGGMIGGLILQTLILLYVTFRTDWNKEVVEHAKSNKFYHAFLYFFVIYELKSLIICHSSSFYIQLASGITYAIVWLYFMRQLSLLYNNNAYD